MRGRVFWVAVLIAAAGWAGCVEDDAAEPAAVEASAVDDPDLEPLNFSTPTHLNPEGQYGYEPSIQIGQEGTLYVTAHKDSLVREDDRLASWLWYSTDGGETWSDLPSPAQAHEKLFAFEGSLAVDDENRLYFIDTYAADNTLSVWQGSEEGPAWQSTRPVHGTTGVDDRPWLAAHGNGVVYYVGNNGAPVPAANNLDQPGDTSRYWFYTSEDGGTTWSLGHGFPASGWCTPTANPADDQVVHVACDRWPLETSTDPINTESAITVYESRDRGATFERTKVAELNHTVTDGYPATAADADGTPFVAWPDGTNFDDVKTELQYAHPGEAGNWTVHTITPFEGTFEKVWASAGSNGTLGLSFYGTDSTDPGRNAEWYAYTMVTDEAESDDPNWTLAKPDDRPVALGPDPPGDFLQNDVGPDDRLHVVYERRVESPDSGPTQPTHNDPARNLYHVSQSTGPNLAGSTDDA